MWVLGCGPHNGPQCVSCQRFQGGFGEDEEDEDGGQQGLLNIEVVLKFVNTAIAKWFSTYPVLIASTVIVIGLVLTAQSRGAKPCQDRTTN